MIETPEKKTKTAIVLESIKAIREMRHYTQEYMAFKLNITQSDYSYIEKGTILLSMDRLFLIAEILDVTAIFILEFGIPKILPPVPVK